MKLKFARKPDFGFFLPGADLSKYSQGKSWFAGGYPSFDVEAFENEFRKIIAAKPSGGQLLHLLVTAFAAVNGENLRVKSGWVSKTTRNEQLFPTADDLFGNGARFVYVIRDPRDVYVSQQKRKAIAGQKLKSKLGELIRFAIRWQSQVAAAECFAQRNAAKCKFIKYENLVTEPKQTIEDLAEWLEVGFENCLLEPTRLKQPWGGNSVHRSEMAGISTESIGRFVQLLSMRDKRLIQALLREELVRYGYVVDGETSPLDRFSGLLRKRRAALSWVRKRLQQLP